MKIDIEDDTISLVKAEMACYERYLRRGLAARVREELDTEIDQAVELSEYVLKKRIGVVVQDAQYQLFQQYKTSRIAELQGCHGGNNCCVDTTSQGQAIPHDPRCESDDAESYLNRMFHEFNGVLFDFDFPTP